MSRTFAELEARLAAVESRLMLMEAGLRTGIELDRINTDLQILATGQSQITSMLQTLIDRKAGK